MYDTNDFKIFLLVIVLIVTLISSICIGFNAYSCRTKAVMQDMKWSYGPIQGCMVKQENGKWIDYNRLRYMND